MYKMQSVRMIHPGPSSGSTNRPDCSHHAPRPDLFEVRGDGREPKQETGVTNVLRGVHTPILEKILELYTDLYLHDGFGTITVEMRFLKRGQKEIIVSSGKEYRFVVDWPEGVREEGK
jgi:hypothetical protein